MPVEAVVFDFGGVLMRTEDRMPRAQLAAHLGLSYDQLSALVFDSQSAVLATKGELRAGEHWQELQRVLGLSEAEINQVQVEFWAGDVLDEDLVELLRRLRKEYTTGLLSNAWDDLRGQIEGVWRIADAFDQIFISSELGMIKPEPNIYLWMIEKLAVEPSRVVFVDDFIENIEGARAAGIQAIHFRSPEQVREQLQKILAQR